MWYDMIWYVCLLKGRSPAKERKRNCCCTSRRHLTPKHGGRHRAVVTCILWNVFHDLHFLCSAATLLGSGTIQAAPECSINVFPWASSQLTKNWRKYIYYFLCLFEFSVPVWLGLRNANTKKKLKTVKLEQIKWIQVWKTAGKMTLYSQWIILKGKCSRWLHKDYSKDWTSIRTEPTRGWGAGGVKRRNTGERNEWKNTRNSGRSW